MKLSDLTVNCSATVLTISNLPIETRQQIATLGILPKTLIKLTRVAPFGGTVQIQIRNNFIALNQTIANAIEVEAVSTKNKE